MSDIVAGMTRISTGNVENLKGKAQKDSPAQLANAASQFEALLIGQLLQSAHGADGEGWLGTDDGDAGSTMTQMSEQVLSTSLASKGGLGLAKMVEHGLQKTSHEVQPVKQGD